MEKVRNGIYATAMDNFIREKCQEIQDEETAMLLFDDWLQLGVPDGNTLGDNIADFGDNDDYEELLWTFCDLCKTYQLKSDLKKYANYVLLSIENRLTYGV